MCGHCWDISHRKFHFSMDDMVWESIMNNIFEGWSSAKMVRSEKCRLLDSYMNTADNIAWSLVTEGKIDVNEVKDFEAALLEEIQKECDLFKREDQVLND